MSKLALPQVSLILVLAGSFAAGWHPLVETLALALRDSQYTHILLVLPVSVALIFLEWPLLRQMFAPDVRPGGMLLGLAFFLVGWSHLRPSLPSDVRLSIAMVALVLCWIGAFVLCLGLRATRSLLFPLCFLFWIVPLPQTVVAEIVNLLQQGSAWIADALFAAVGVPVAKDGVVLTIPGLTVEVAQECSSIRSSSMLLVTTMVLAQLMLRSPWRKTLVIAVAVPLSVAKNGLRIFTIAMLGTRVDSGYLTGRLHHQGGVVFFTMALMVVFILIWILKRGEVGAAALHPPSPRDG